MACNFAAMNAGVTAPQQGRSQMPVWQVNVQIRLWLFCCVTVTFQICTVTGITKTRCHSTYIQSNMGETQNIAMFKQGKESVYFEPSSRAMLKVTSVHHEFKKKKKHPWKDTGRFEGCERFFLWPPKITEASQMLRFPFVLYYFKKWLSYYACPWRFMIFVVDFVMKINFIWNDQHIIINLLYHSLTFTGI